MNHDFINSSCRSIKNFSRYFTLEIAPRPSAVYSNNKFLQPGPAILEEIAEFFPIIKFKKEMLKIAEQFPTPAQIGYEDEEKSYILNYCAALNDKEYYIDYFNSYGDLAADDHADIILQQNRLRGIIVKNISTTKSFSVTKKMLWAIDKFNGSKYIDNNYVKNIDFKIGAWKKIKINVWYWLHSRIKKIILKYF